MTEALLLDTPTWPHDVTRQRGYVRFWSVCTKQGKNAIKVPLQCNACLLSLSPTIPTGIDHAFTNVEGYLLPAPWLPSPHGCKGRSFVSGRGLSFP
jgi:hypothetical protein